MARQVMEDPHHSLAVPVIALAEVCLLVERGRTSIKSVDELLAALGGDTRISIVPLDLEIVKRSCGLPQVTEMHDRQIVATALLLAESGQLAGLVTRDENITASGVVPIVW